MGDQTHWAARMRALGVAPAPLTARTLTAPDLAEAISTAVTDRHLKHRAHDIARLVRAEDGVNQAVNSLLTHIPLTLPSLPSDFPRRSPSPSFPQLPPDFPLFPLTSP